MYRKTYTLFSFSSGRRAVTAAHFRTNTIARRSSDGFRGRGCREVVYFCKSARGRCRRRRWRQTLQNYYYTLVDGARAPVCVCLSAPARGRRCRAVRRTLKIQPCQGQTRTCARAPLVHYNIIIMCVRAIVLQCSLPCIFLFTIIVLITTQFSIYYLLLSSVHTYTQTQCWQTWMYISCWRKLDRGMCI